MHAALKESNGDTIMKDEKHIILIGFKNTGKSTVGRMLAHDIQKNFIDLDERIEAIYTEKTQEKLSCRQIMYKQGESYFRALESEALNDAIQSESAVISLGGGAPLRGENQTLIKPYLILHVTAPRGIVFERIMINGRPAFFSPDESPFEFFTRIWEEREKVYKELADMMVNNNGTLSQTVELAKEALDAFKVRKIKT